MSKIKRKRQLCRCGKKRPHFNFEGETKAICCSECKEPGMVDIKNKKCRCGKKRPAFNFEGETKAICCSECREPGMVDIIHKKCRCGKKRPSFNFEGETKAVCCSDCKEPGMVDIKNKKCRCGKKRPAFNFEGETKAICCSDCKEPGMVDIKNKKCRCGKKRPYFNFEGETKAICCSECREAGMVDIKHEKCRCGKKRPSFNFEGETKAICCSECKEPGMVNIKNKKCSCGKKRPTYNFEGETKAVCCSECKEAGMVDIIHKKCRCGTTASYGYPQNLPKACVQHKEEGMISKPRARCLKKSCKNPAEYGVQRPIHCETHKDENDINLVERKCVRCDRIDVLTEENVCINFCLKDEEYKMYQKRQKLKESRVYKLLLENVGEPDSCDKMIDSNCGKESRHRPDFMYDCKTHMVVIEVDENQHNGNCQEGEMNRMRNIFFAYEGVPIVVVRYNPDSFIYDGKKNSVPVAKKEDILLRWVKKAMEEKPKYHMSVVYLFYDGYKDTVKDFEEIDPYSNLLFGCECGEQFYIYSKFEEHGKECNRNS
jgi:hypothetical protein